VKPFNCSKKGKVVPLRSIEAHLGDRRYSSYSFLTSALEGGERSASRPGRALPPGKEPPVPIVQEAVWAPEPVWTQRLEKKSSASVGDRTPAVQSIVRHYTDWATPDHCSNRPKWKVQLTHFWKHKVKSGSQWVSQTYKHPEINLGIKNLVLARSFQFTQMQLNLACVSGPNFIDH
jgi:hypothetical protein